MLNDAFVIIEVLKVVNIAIVSSSSLSTYDLSSSIISSQYICSPEKIPSKIGYEVLILFNELVIINLLIFELLLECFVLLARHIVGVEKFSVVL